jgi:hypothetical protein
LAVAKVDVLGASGHRFLLNSPLKDAHVRVFEWHHNVRLPVDYRHFLTAGGNGGAGPYYGVFPLGKMDGLYGSLKPWSKEDGVVGVPSRPFLLIDEWNDLQEMPSDELRKADEQEYKRRFEQFEKRYFDSSLVDGAIPICHLGSALRIWLIVTGVQAGRLWYDGRAEYSGLKPVRLADGSPATFSSWYSEWLENALHQIPRRKKRRHK